VTSEKDKVRGERSNKKKKTPKSPRLGKREKKRRKGAIGRDRTKNVLILATSLKGLRMWE